MKMSYIYQYRQKLNLKNLDEKFIKIQFSSVLVELHLPIETRCNIDDGDW